MATNSKLSDTIDTTDTTDTTYTIEIVFDLSLREYCSTLATLKKICSKYNARHIYSTIDPDILSKSKTCIFTAVFEQDDIYSLVVLIREIKILSKIYIESIHKDENILLYASKSYLKLHNDKMKNKIKNEIEKNTNAIYNDDESVLIKEIKQICGK